MLRNGKASTLAVVNNVKAALPKILAGLPPELQVRQLFDQSLFVRAAINGVVREAVTAACLTGLMILIFLGSWRSTVIVCISIPLSILVSLIVLNLMGETINVMTLGGLALAVGILVDDATVEIENTHRNMAMKKPLVRAVLDGAQQIAAPAFVSTLSICIVFVPVLLLTGAAKYLFTPLALAVVFAMLASYLLSRTLIPTMVHYMLQAGSEALRARASTANRPAARASSGALHYVFNRRFELMRASYAVAAALVPGSSRSGAGGLRPVRRRPRCALAVFIGRDFFPTVDSGQMRLHARAPSGTRIEETEVLFASIENEIRQVIPPREIDTIIDNIGIPFGGFNLAFGDNPTIGNGDGDILISLKEGEHGSTAEYTDRLRKRLHQKFPDVVFFFEAANITNQILELRPAGAHRRAGGGAQRRRPITRSPSRLAAADRADSRRRRRAHSPGGGLPGNRCRRGPRQGRPGGPDAEGRQQQPADLAHRQRPDRAHPVAGLAHRGQLLRGRADAAIPPGLAWTR